MSFSSMKFLILDGDSPVTPTIEKPFLSPVKGYSETIHQIDDLGSPVSHFLDGWLVLQKIAAVHGGVEVLPLRIAKLSRLIIAAVDATLSTNAVRAFYWRET